MKLSSETLQNLPYLWNKKTQIVYYVFHILATLDFFKVNALVYVDRNPNPNLLEMKNPFGFSYSKNMANFEVFH